MKTLKWALGPDVPAEIFAAACIWVVVVVGAAALAADFLVPKVEEGFEAGGWMSPGMIAEVSGAADISFADRAPFTVVRTNGEGRREAQASGDLFYVDIRTTGPSEWTISQGGYVHVSAEFPGLGRGTVRITRTWQRIPEQILAWPMASPVGLGLVLIAVFAAPFGIRRVVKWIWDRRDWPWAGQIANNITWDLEIAWAAFAAVAITWLVAATVKLWPGVELSMAIDILMAICVFIAARVALRWD